MNVFRSGMILASLVLALPATSALADENGRDTRPAKADTAVHGRGLLGLGIGLGGRQAVGADARLGVGLGIGLGGDARTAPAERATEKEKPKRTQPKRKASTPPRKAEKPQQARNGECGGLGLGLGLGLDVRSRTEASVGGHAAADAKAGHRR
jgi:hypothetical protein